jgi:hypothetical protein
LSEPRARRAFDPQFPIRNICNQNSDREKLTMTAAAAQLPREIDIYLSRFVLRRRMQRAIGALGRAAVFTLVWVALWCLLDRLIGLPAIVRAIGLITNIACVVAMIVRPILAMVQRINATDAALEIERRQPRFAQRLATVTSRALGPSEYAGSQPLLDELMREVCQLAGEEDPAALLPWSRALRGWVIFAGLLLLILPMMGWSWLDAPTLLRRYLMPLAPMDAVTTTRLSVTPGDIALPAGDALRVVVRARHLNPDAPPPVLHVRSSAGTWFEQPMTPAREQGFSARIAHVARDLEYFVTAGDATSGRSSVTVLAKPGVAAFMVHYEYPPYTRLSPRDDQISDGAIQAPVGTQVTLSIQATQPLRLASISMGQQSLRMSATGDPSRWEARFTIHQDDQFTIRMAGKGGASAAFRGGTIRAVPDRPPVAVLPAASADAGGRNGAELPADGIELVRYQAADDYPLARLDLELGISGPGSEPRRMSFSLPAGGAPQSVGAWRMDLHALGAHEGDRISVRLRAEDQAGQLDLSAPRVWRIVAPTGAHSSGGEKASSSAAAQPAGGESPVPLDPPGYAQALEAYFQSLRKPNQDR